MCACALLFCYCSVTQQQHTLSWQWDCQVYQCTCATRSVSKTREGRQSVPGVEKESLCFAVEPSVLLLKYTSSELWCCLCSSMEQRHGLWPNMTSISWSLFRCIAFLTFWGSPCRIKFRKLTSWRERGWCQWRNSLGRDAFNGLVMFGECPLAAPMIAPEVQT